MDEITKIAVSTVSAAGLLWLVLQIIKAAKGLKNGKEQNGADKLLLTQIAASVAEMSKTVALQTQTFTLMVEANKRFTELTAEVAAMVKRGVDPERQVTQKLMNDMEQRLTTEIRDRST